MNSMRIDHYSIRVAATAFAALTLAACGGGDYENDDEPAPRAVATSLGQPFTADSNGSMRMTVRSGSEVVLSGKDSSKGADDTGLPLIRFDWRQTAGANPVHLVYRTANTVSFNAPQVTQDTTLRFTLTVSDARGTTASAEAQVLVRPVRDADRFLQFLGATGTFPVVLATQTAIPGSPTAQASEILPLQITLTKLVSFTDRSGVPRMRVVVGSPVTLSGTWSTRIGTSTSCTANENPTLQLPVPRIDLDDALAAPIAAFPDATLLSDVMEASDIDDVTLEVRIELSSGNAGVTAAGPRICIGGTARPSGEAFATESLHESSAPRDSKAASQAYYAAIDPTGAKDTMNEWLTVNGFNLNAANWGADAHAVYTNNYDLGFGRDMYMKFGACDAGTSTLPLSQRAGRCDVAAIVVNYADVESAAKKLNPIIVVAMEYSAGPGGGARFVKFYTFAPDRRTGEYERVLSVNLDRRGEQYMPQACVVCHGGTPGTAASYATNADVNATFLPWDLDSLLYSDTDPGFSTKQRNAALKAQYTRAAQQAQLKRLNEGAYLTYPTNHPIAGRYALARELVEKWYGGPNLPNATFDDSGTPAGWMPAGANNNPADSHTIYHSVFARNCRSCHVMQVPSQGDPRTATLQPPGVTQPLSACGNDVRLANTEVGAPQQVPMGCYWQFAHAPNLADRLSRGHMPFARRTMDRMWIDAAGAQTVAQLLQTHMQNVQSTTVTAPGTVAAGFEATPANVDIDGVLALDSGASMFANSFGWTVEACTGTPSAPGTCNRSLPVVGSTGAAAKFVVDSVATYRITQTLNGGQPSAVTYFQVVDRPLAMVTSPSVSFQIGGAGALPTVVSTPGNGSLARHTMRLTPSAGFSVSPASCTSPNGCPADTTVSVSSSAVVQTSGSIGVSVTDAGGEVRTTTVSTLAQSTFTAQPLTLNNPVIRSNAASAANFAVLAAARTAVGRSDVTISSLTYNTASGRTPINSSFDGTTLSYRPQGGFATHDMNGARPSGAPALEQYSYQLRRPDTGEVSSSTITIPILARTSFENARARWTTVPCTSCHYSGGSGPDIGGMSYSAIRNGALSLYSVAPNRKPYVDLSNVAQSGLLCWPLDNCTSPVPSTAFHDGFTRTAEEMAVVRQWIEDGANNF